MIRRLLLLSVCFICLSAQGKPLSYAFLNKLTESPTTLTGQFKQKKYLKQFDTTITSQGHFKYKRNRYIHWITETPITNSLTMTPNSITSSQDGNEMLHIDANKNPVAKILSKVFFAVLTAQWEDLSEYFTVQKQQQSGNSWTVTLIPKENLLNQSLYSINLSGDKLLKNITLLEKSGDSTQIQFSHLSASE